MRDAPEILWTETSSSHPQTLIFNNTIFCSQFLLLLKHEAGLSVEVILYLFLLVHTWYMGKRAPIYRASKATGSLAYTYRYVH